MVNWKIQNTVFVLKFNKIFNLDLIANELLKYDNFFISYEPENFPGIIIKIKNDKEKYGITLFRSGLASIYGIKDNINKIYDIIELLKKLLNKCGIDVPNHNYIELKNVTISGKFDYNNIDIEKMYYDFDDAKYDPSLFPAVTIYYNVSDGYKITFNIFRNGAFTCAGIRSNIDNIYQHINEIVNSFQEKVIKKYVKQ
jgi:TATA-box binding protein (TBP) (component of TFIID and TFIIIB)